MSSATILYIFEILQNNVCWNFYPVCWAETNLLGSKHCIVYLVTSLIRFSDITNSFIFSDITNSIFDITNSILWYHLTTSI